MITVTRIDRRQFDTELQNAKVLIPIEQTDEWSRFQATIPGRSPWGCVRISKDGKPIAYASFSDYETHGYRYLRSHHGPIWIGGEPDESMEKDALTALTRFIHQEDPKVVFIRLAVEHEIRQVTRPALSIVPYDSTVVIDVTGGDEAILKRMKPRGRRDVRKSLRESPISCADETEMASKSFQEYYQLMVETGKRDGFTPSPISEYESMIRILGPEHCRVFAGRLDGKVVTWSIITVSGHRAVRYYAASSTRTMRRHVGDKLVYFECCALGKSQLGVTDYDLMGIGSPMSPSLYGLNEFKTKFTKEITHVPPDRDVPVRHGFYRALVAGKHVLNVLRGDTSHGTRESEHERKVRAKKQAESRTSTTESRH